MEKRLPLSRIAEAVGVSKMTVSRALREGTSVAPLLRANIREVAERMGYRPDLRLAEVMSAIRRSQTPVYRENLAFVWTHHQGRSGSRFFEAEFAGAKRQAGRLGYKLEEFRPKHEALSGRALTRILQSRGIRGVLVAPPGHERNHPRVWLDWDRFCCVFIGRSMVNAGVARVHHDHYGGAALAVRQLRRLGYRRPGLVISRSMDERSTRLVRAGFLSFHPAAPAEARSLVFAAAQYDRRRFTRWRERTRPDGIVTHFEEEFPTLGQVRSHLGGGLGLATLNRSSDQTGLAGVDQHRDALGEQAVDLLLNHLQSRRFGRHPLAPSILLPGSWVDGASAMPRGSGGDAFS